MIVKAAQILHCVKDFLSPFRIWTHHHVITSCIWEGTSAVSSSDTHAQTFVILHDLPCWSRWSLHLPYHMAFPPQAYRANTERHRPSPSPHSQSPPCTPSSECRSSPGGRSEREDNAEKDSEGEKPEIASNANRWSISCTSYICSHSRIICFKSNATAKVQKTPSVKWCLTRKWWMRKWVKLISVKFHLKRKIWTCCWEDLNF